MDGERWRRMETLFHAALTRPAPDRPAFLDEACSGDAGLRDEIESLLRHEPHADAFMHDPTSTVIEDVAHLAQVAPVATPSRIGAYRIVKKLGEGGMGVVFVAVDERLGRRVALKLLRPGSADPQAGRRLVREARLAASLSHPHICQVHELGEWEGQPFVAMELLDGVPLSRCLAERPLPASDALDLALAIAEALVVLHSHGIVHRDLKPSNIFVTASGIKLLDFGLARTFQSPEATATLAPLTQAGAIVGTPQYAAPEQLTGGAVDARADVFSLGVMLFEMLAGQRPFAGRTLAAVVHAVLYETPPVLTGSAAIAALDRVLHRALAKQPEHRYPSATSFAAALRDVATLVHADDIAHAQPILRLAVLPFRLLNPDREIDYLAGSFAEALTSALSGLESVVVRSSLRTARYSAAPPDLDRVAVDLAVDVVLTGSMLRQNDKLRVTAELVSVPAGDVWWTQTSTVPVGAVFDLHEQLAARVLASLPLGVRDRGRAHGFRANSTKAFDLYLRAIPLRMEASSWRQARSYFEQCLELDPGFAPAWAERGRLDRILAKYEDPGLLARAEAAFREALRLDPDNGAAHHYYAQLEVDMGRVADALIRLVARAAERRAEPQLYAALVHACRYGGLLEASVAADDRARQLDPTTTTSVPSTFYLLGEYERALEEAHRGSDPLESRVLGAMGREAEAIAAARREEERFSAVRRLRGFSTALRAALEGDRDAALSALEILDPVSFSDGEGLLYIAQVYARLGDVSPARHCLERAVEAGFLCADGFERDPFLAPLRKESWWQPFVDEVRRRAAPIRRAFDEAGGPAVLLVR